MPYPYNRVLGELTVKSWPSGKLIQHVGLGISSRSFNKANDHDPPAYCFPV